MTNYTKQELKEMKKALKKARPFYKKKRTWVGAFFGIIILSAIFSGGGETEKPQAVPTSGTVKQVQKKADKNFYIGDGVKFDDVTIQVTSVKEADHVGDTTFGEKAQGKFVIVDMSIKNEQKEAIQFLENNFTLTEKDGTKYEYATTAGIYVQDEGEQTFFLAKINPKNTMTGKVVFDIPKEVNTKDLTLNAETGIWSSKSVKIKLTSK